MSAIDRDGVQEFHHQQRRRRRRNFSEALLQSQSDSHAKSVDVGQILREVRIQRGLTIRDLARISGLNVNTLSMVENGKTSPSLETLQQLSSALGTPMAAFFKDTSPKKKIVFHKASKPPGVAFAYGTLEDLGLGMNKRGVESFLVTLEPHSNSGDNLMVHTGLEIVFCVEGQLTYTIEGQNYLLEPGDSLFFEAYLPHRWQNLGTIPTCSLLVLCAADDQDSPTERHFQMELAGVEGQ